MDGKLVLYVECLICRHVGEIPKANLDPDVLPVALKQSLRCSQCGTLGEVEVRLGWSGGATALQGAGNDCETTASDPLAVTCTLSRESR